MNSENQNPQQMPATVTQESDHVLIQFDEQVPNQAVKEQIESCEDGTCSCCTPEFRDEVDAFEVIDQGSSVDVKISGTISADHVKENLIACAPKLAKEE